VNILEGLVVGNGIFDLVESLLYVAGTIFAAILIALSISAYRNTHLRKLLYAIIAFLLFGIFLFYEYLEHAIPLDNPFTDIILPSMALSILVLFFLAIVNKR
jgi:peptidoglycan/LPS O-acetylase OafA/YrhL